MTLIATTTATWALVLAAPLLARLLGRQAGWPLAGGLLAAAAGLIHLRATSGDVAEEVPWLPAIDVALRLRLDGLGFLFALLVLVVGALVLMYSTAYVRQPRPDYFYGLMTAFAAAMLVLVLADDLIVLFVAWELTTLCSYLLILRSGPAAGGPATRTLLVTAAGGLCLLGAVATVTVTTGTTQISAALAHEAWTTRPAFATTAAVLVAVAAMTKSAQFPFHSWLPDAMVAPAPVSAYLHAAAMVKAGIFLLLLFAPATSISPVWQPLLIGVGVLTTIMGALFALQRTDLKELLAYSTVSQLGLLVAVIGIGTPTAMLAAAVHVVSHAVFKAAGFMTVGLLERRTGTRDIREVSGLWRAMRWDAVMLTLVVVSMAGIPPAIGFVSKELIFDAFLTSQAGTAIGWAVAIAVTVGATLTVAYSARMLVTTLPGTPVEATPSRETTAMRIPITLLAVSGLTAGVLAWFLDDLTGAAAAVAAAVPREQISGLSLWHGVNTALLLSVAAVAGGWCLTLMRRRIDTALGGRRLFPATGVQVVQRIHDGIITFGHRVGDLTRSDSPAAHLAVPLVAIGLATAGLTRLWRGVPDTGAIQPLDLLLLGVLTLGALTVARATARLTAVVAAGIVGFSVVLWYVALGASDVALTQLLVEILTVVVMVLVIRRLPGRFQQSTRRRARAAAVAAAAAGTAATVAVLVFTGHRDISPAGEFYLRNAADLTGGSNVVNTILVDFRALDTMGELVVLAIGAAAITVLLRSRRAVSRDVVTAASPVLDDARGNALFLGVLEKGLIPLMLFGSAYTLLRGHNAPGGGFIAALIGAAAVVLAYLSPSTDATSRLDRPYLKIAGTGIAVAVVTGFIGLFEGSFLRPLHAEVLGLKFTSALVFDVGVYLAVIGVILAAVSLLGTSPGQGRSSAKARPGDERSEAPAGARSGLAPEGSDR